MHRPHRVIDRVEAIDVGGALVRIVTQRRRRRKGNRPVLLDTDGPRPVHKDVDHPRLEGRSALEAVDAAQHRDPRLLNYLLGHGVGRDVHEGDADQHAVPPTHQLGERHFIASSQESDELALRCPCRDRTVRSRCLALHRANLRHECKLQSA